MRVEIKTKQPIKDKDIRALYLVNEALEPLDERMKIATLNFFADKLGLVIRKP